MANFLTKSINGVMQLVAAVGSFTGNANEIIQTNADGFIDVSLLPATVGGNTISNLTAGVNLTAGDLVAIDASGEVVLADNTALATAAIGFVVSSYTAADTDVVVYIEGVNDQLTGLTAGSRYYLGTGGAVSATPPTFALDEVCQYVGNAISATTLSFEAENPIVYSEQ